MLCGNSAEKNERHMGKYFIYSPYAIIAIEFIWSTPQQFETGPLLLTSINFNHSI